MTLSFVIARNAVTKQSISMQSAIKPWIAASG